MKTFNRARYYTMNSWNLSTSLAYNLKVYNVIDNELQNKVYELMDTDGFYDDINYLISDFNYEFKDQWRAGFNGRSGGYLVLYNANYNGTVELSEVPIEVRKAFRQLAVDIVKTTEYLAKNATIKEEEVEYTKTIKVLSLN